MGALFTRPRQIKYALPYDIHGMRIALAGGAFSLCISLYLMVALFTRPRQIKYALPNDIHGMRIALAGGAFDTIIPSASTFGASSSGTKHPPFDVFINHCGKDVKETLASRIYKSLDATGLKVFLDKPELKYGDLLPKALEEAMATATIGIAIFSEHYAESPWCLAELEYMVKTGRTIIPIFYKVDPSVLRWAVAGAEKTYIEAFRRHEKKGRYAPEALQRWKEALQQASVCIGGIIKSIDDEEKVVKEVVNRVKELKNTVPLDVAKHPVGLNEVVQDFDHTISHQSAGSRVKIIGIWGMGGSGKTTLAKEIFNRRCSHMHWSSFLSDVRDAARKGLLLEKQKTLLKNFGVKADECPDNIDEGKQILKTRLLKNLDVKADECPDNIDEAKKILKTPLPRCVKGVLLEKQKTLSKDLDLKDERHENLDGGKQTPKNCLSRSASVLIVLDDVDHIDQLDALLPSKESFENNIGDQSLIMVTTRDKNVLQQWGISAIYPMKPLEAVHAKQLFCWHAFKQIIPKEGFEDVVEKFLNACTGLPLSLKVLGGQLCGESDEEYWLQTLNRYSQIPHDDISNRLKVSYDALKKQEQQMFLDVACFFIGKRSSAAIAAWNAEFHGLIGWKTLFNKCLVEEDEDGLIGMHDHLRDLGRVIASEESPYRLWSPQQIIEILPQQEPIRVRGVASAVGKNCYQRQGKIIIKANQEEFSFAPWLGLKIFIGNGNFLSQEQNQLSKDLIWLQCTYFEHKNLPPWLGLKNLRILDLSDSDSLEHLWAADADSNFGELTELRHLDLSGCTKLEALPDSFKKLTQLEYLSLWGCREVAIKSESNVFENMTKLRYLNLKGTGVKELPANIFHLTNLTKLEIGSDFLITLPTSVGSLSPLTTITIEGCQKLLSLPDSLEHLSLLRDLRIEHTGVKCLPKSLIHLQSLTISFTPISELSFRSWGMLKSLDLSMRRVSNISIGGDSCPALETLDLFSNDDLRELETLPDKLKTLKVSFCKELEKIENLGNMRLLKELKIFYCQKLERIEGLKNIKSLCKIDLRNCPNLTNIEDLENTRSLEEFIISDCQKLEALPSLPEITSQQELQLVKCHKLKTIKGLESIKSLRKLRIYYCKELDGFPGLGELSSLQEFVLKMCPKVKNIDGLEKIRSLKKLEISDCQELDGFPGLGELSSLKEFVLKMCPKLKKMEGLGNMRSLEKLIISDCLELESLPNLSEITSLEEFHLETCYKLEKIEGLERLRRLKKLRVHTRWNAPRIVSLEHSEKLRSLDVVANDISAVEPFVSNIQTWPSEVMICSRAVCDVGLLKNFFQNMPNVSFLDYAVVLNACIWGEYLELSLPESSAIADTTLICFIIDSDHPDLRLSISPPDNDEDSDHPQGAFNSELGEGKWVWMDVSTQRRRSVDYYHISARDSKGERVKVRVEAARGEEGSLQEMESEEGSLLGEEGGLLDSEGEEGSLLGEEGGLLDSEAEEGSLLDSEDDDVKVRVEAAWLVTGEEGSIVEAFRQHFQRSDIWCRPLLRDDFEAVAKSRVMQKAPGRLRAEGLWLEGDLKRRLHLWMHKNFGGEKSDGVHPALTLGDRALTIVELISKEVHGQ